MKYISTNSKVARKIILLFSIVFLAFFPAVLFGQSWSTVGSGGMNDWVYASTIYNGDLIVGGKFTSAGGVSANHIARWDGATWSPLGLGVNSKVNALIVHDGLLYVGGEFTEAGGIPMNFIAIWDGTQWLDDLGDMGSIVTSFAVYNNNLIVGGYFDDADGLIVNCITEYTSNGWAALGTGMGGSQKQVMTLEVYNNELIAAGFFTTAGGVSANHIAKWNGTSWASLGLGISNIVYTLGNYNGQLIAGGLFLSAGGAPANHIASWDGTTWSPLGSGMSGTFYQYVFALKVYNGNLIAGGYFTHSNGVATNGIAKWDGTAWSDLNGGLFYPGNVFGCHTLCVYGTDLIVGGLFSSAGGTSSSHLAAWYETPSGILETEPNSAMIKNYPNPFNHHTTLSYNIPFAGIVKLSISDLAGREVLPIVNNTMQPGDYTYELSGSNLSNGMYFVRIICGNKSETIKIIKN
jgi:trimeric autotransporter adhesin